MRTIGILGGMSWESTALYYRHINEQTRARLGGLHSARIVLISVDFAPIEALQASGDWEAAGAQLAQEARRIEEAGADFLLLATNTMHRCAAAIESAVRIPLLHLAEATAAALAAAGRKRAGLLGTRHTMEQAFYRERIERSGIVVEVPEHAERSDLDHIIFDELCQGIVRDAARERVRSMVDGLRARGCDSVIAGCTEITMLVEGDDLSLPLFDTTAIHAEAAVASALGDRPS